MNLPGNPKIALVHDWLTSMRGGSKVLEAFCKLFPSADLFTLLHFPGTVSELIEDRKLFTSFINRLPFLEKHYRNYLPLFPTAIELFSFKEYDIIISSSHCVAKGVRTPPGTLHISYLHTPMRYVWDMYEEYFGEEKLGVFSRKLIPLISNYLRIWDVSSSNRVDYFIANSRHVAKRIWKYYRREATVIYPPVDTTLFNLGNRIDNYYLIVSALVPYKKIELAIKVFQKNGKRLLIIGEGPERENLQKKASKNIEFMDWQPHNKLAEYYSGCRALIFPGEEDFGIVPVEAQCCGKPVIAYGRGGALETIIGYDGSNQGKCTGIFFNEQSISSLDHGLNQFESIDWNGSFIHHHAQKFNETRFLTESENFIIKSIEHNSGLK
jgi:glycosyltransferase involved in cell wall biosynthesis